MRETLSLVLALMLTTAAAAAPPRAEGWAGEARWLALEREGVKIAAVEIVVRGIFPITGAAQPWYERAANKLHVETDEPVVRAHLLFAVGDKVNARRIYETERRLRALPYLREAEIEPGVRTRDGVVVRVLVDDAWSLKLSVSYDSTGGQASSGFAIEDSNVFGTGKSISFSTTSDVVTDSKEVNFADPSFFGSHWTMDLHHLESSNGDGDMVRIALPFVRTDSPWSFTARFGATEDELLFWNLGEQAYGTTSERQAHLIEVGKLIRWSGDAGWRTRLALRGDYFDYGPLVVIDASLRPPPTLNSRVLNGVVWSIERYHDHFQTFKNLALVDRFEDYNLGFDAKLELGRFPASAGSTTDAATAAIAATWAARFEGDDMIFINAKHSGRRESGDAVVDGILSLIGTGYLRRYEGQTWVGRAQYEARWTPDPEHLLYLGGVEGLYGYPNYYKTGDRRWTFHVEDRWLTDQVLWNSFRVGYAAFVEAGQIRESTPTGPRWTSTYADVGGGLRIGSLRGAFGNVLYFMLAVPVVRDPGMPSYQIVVGDTVQF